jgi:hypothetical protein
MCALIVAISASASRISPAAASAQMLARVAHRQVVKLLRRESLERIIR